MGILIGSRCSHSNSFRPLTTPLVSETTEEVRQFAETGQRHENEAVKGYQRLGVNGFVLCLSFGVFHLWPLLSAGYLQVGTGAT